MRPVWCGKGTANIGKVSYGIVGGTTKSRIDWLEARKDPKKQGLATVLSVRQKGKYGSDGVPAIWLAGLELASLHERNATDAMIKPSTEEENRARGIGLGPCDVSLI